MSRRACRERSNMDEEAIIRKATLEDLETIIALRLEYIAQSADPSAPETLHHALRDYFTRRIPVGDCRVFREPLKTPIF